MTAISRTGAGLCRVAVFSILAASMPVFLAGCAQPTPTNSAAASTPPAGTVQYTLDPPPIGTTFEYLTRSPDGHETITELRVAGIKTFNGRDVYDVKAGDAAQLYDAKTLSWVADIDPDGNPVNSATPHNGQFDWPLWVGKSWSPRYDVKRHRAGKTFRGIDPRWTVEALETVTVPAGTFEALRLRSAKGSKADIRSVVWFAPAIGTIVKRRQHDGDDRDERVLFSIKRPTDAGASETAS